MTGESDNGAFQEDEWEYDAFRVGRVTRTVEVKAPDGSTVIEEGTIRFDPINEEDQWLWEEEEWIDWMIAPDGGVGLEGGQPVPHDKLGILEFPEPMTRQEAHEWLEEDDQRWRQFLDETIESDTTAEELLGDVR